MLCDATFVCLSSIDWDFNWQIPQEVASRFAAEGNHVLFVENTGVRPPALKDATRLAARARNWLRASGRPRRVSERLDVFSPVVLPLPYSAAACRFNREVLRRSIRRWIGVRDDRPTILLTFLPTPLARSLATVLDPSLLVYYCADRLPESSPGARRLVGPERVIFEEADVVFATSQHLLKTASEYARRAVLLSSGVRYHDFRRGAQSAADPPPPLRDVRGPVVGFTGSLRNEIDLALIARVARLLPDMTFVMVGPAVTDVGLLAGCPNVRLVGAVPHAEVVRYTLSFDVGLLPYVVNPFTDALRPVKLTEYLAAGLPVISTNLPEVRRFVDEHGPVVAFADTAETFAHAIRRALSNNGAAAVARRLDVARGYDWAIQIKVMSAVMESALNRDERGAPPLAAGMGS